MLKINKSLLLIVALISNSLTSCSPKYEVNKNAHSHNDYLQDRPFYEAYSNHFASMEADIFLINNELYVAHSKKQVDKQRTLESLYIDPLLKEIKSNKANMAYNDGGKLQILIDLKTEAEPTLRCLEAKLKPIRKYFDTRKNPNAVKLVISGNTPNPDQFLAFDDIFYFDGKRNTKYTPDQMKRVAYFSASLREFTKWNGTGQMLKSDYDKTRNFVDSVHHIGKPVRFWGNPDSKDCWQAFMKMGVDYLNTDSPSEMAKFLERRRLK